MLCNEAVPENDQDNCTREADNVKTVMSNMKSKLYSLRKEYNRLADSSRRTDKGERRRAVQFQLSVFVPMYRTLSAYRQNLMAGRMELAKRAGAKYAKQVERLVGMLTAQSASHYREKWFQDQFADTAGMQMVDSPMTHTGRGCPRDPVMSVGQVWEKEQNRVIDNAKQTAVWRRQLSATLTPYQRELILKLGGAATVAAAHQK